MQWASKVGRREKKGEDIAWTLCSGLPKVGRREKKGESSAWMARMGAPARRFRRASIEGEGHEYFIVFVCFVV